LYSLAHPRLLSARPRRSSALLPAPAALRGVSSAANDGSGLSPMLCASDPLKPRLFTTLPAGPFNDQCNCPLLVSESKYSRAAPGNVKLYCCCCPGVAIAPLTTLPRVKACKPSTTGTTLKP